MFNDRVRENNIEALVRKRQTACVRGNSHAISPLMKFLIEMISIVIDIDSDNFEAFPTRVLLGLFNIDLVLFAGYGLS
jgi:hypothetical protein